MTLNLNGATVSVTSVEDAREQWIKARDENGWGASDMLPGCGEVRTAATEKVIARIAYNGKIVGTP